MKLLNSEYMRKQNIGMVKNVLLYKGNAGDNLHSTTPELAYKKTVKITAEKWMNSASRENALQQRYAMENAIRLTNAATGYDPETIRRLGAIYTIDLIRQADDYIDYTPVLFHDKLDPNAGEIVNLIDHLPYVGKEEDLTGTGDTAPLMEHRLPQQYNVNLKIRGFGDKTTIRELVFNPFHKTEKIISSAARILADEKNKDSIGPIVSAAYDANHSQAADTTGATYDLQLYNTIRKGILKALGLICEPLGRANGLVRHETYILVNDMDVNLVQPVVNGELGKAGGIQQYAGPLQLDGIIPYGGGLNHQLSYGNETLSYPGVAQGEAYIFVKVDVYGGYRIVKQGETMEVSPGDIHGLPSEKRLWYRIRGIHNDFVLPKTTGIGANAKAYGAVIKVTLPVA